QPSIRGSTGSAPPPPSSAPPAAPAPPPPTGAAPPAVAVPSMGAVSPQATIRSRIGRVENACFMVRSPRPHEVTDAGPVAFRSPGTAGVVPPCNRWRRLGIDTARAAARGEPLGTGALRAWVRACSAPAEPRRAHLLLEVVETLRHPAHHRRRPPAEAFVEGALVEHEHGGRLERFHRSGARLV